MVIKDENGKPVILMSKRDILDYIFEKCGLEVFIQAEEEFNKSDEAFTQDDCGGCEALADMEQYAESLETELTELKDKYISFLKSKKYFVAAKALEQMEEEEE